MLARLANRSASLVTRAPAVLGVRHDSHYNPQVKDSHLLSAEEIVSRLDTDIKKREHYRFRWQRMGIPFTQTYVTTHYGFEYFAGGGPGWVWMLFGSALFLPTMYYFRQQRFHDPYVHQHNAAADLEEYERIKSRLSKEPDFWNWEERDGKTTEEES